MKGYFVYMFLNEKEEPLYIGISTNLTTRIETQHFKSLNGNLSQECIAETHSILYHSALSQDDMKIKERYLINTLNPKYNNKMNNENRFSFTIEMDWKLYSIDKENLIGNRENKSKRTRIGNAVFFEKQEIHGVLFFYPDHENDERLTHGCNEHDYFYLINYKNKWFIWSVEIQRNDSSIMSYIDINHINDFDSKIEYNEDYIKEKFKKSNYLFVKSNFPNSIFNEYYYYGGVGEQNILNPKKRLFLEYKFFKKSKYLKPIYIEQIDEYIFNCNNDLEIAS
jgi:hypothetical protein